MHNFFNLFDSLFNHDLGHNSFDNLRNLNYFFNNTWYNNNPFDYLFDFYYFWHLDHLFNDLFNWHFDLFDTIDMSQNFNYFLLDVFDRFRYFDVVIYYFLDLDDLWLPYNDWISDLDYNRDLSLNDLDNSFFNEFLHLNDSFMNNWNLNYSFNFFRYFLVNLYNFSDDLFNLFDSINRYYLLNNDFNCKRSINCVSN